MSHIWTGDKDMKDSENDLPSEINNLSGWKITWKKFYSGQNFRHGMQGSAVYYELTMTCLPVDLISSMDKAMYPVIAKVIGQGSFAGVAWTFFRLFFYFGCLFFCEDHVWRLPTIFQYRMPEIKLIRDSPVRVFWTNMCFKQSVEKGTAFLLFSWKNYFPSWSGRILQW